MPTTTSPNRPGSTLKVAMLIQSYHPRIGGAERQLAALAPLLQRKGVEIHVLTRRYKGLAPYQEINNIPVHRLPVPGPKAVASLTFTLAALSLIRRLRPDVVHAHEMLSPATTATFAKFLFDVPILVKVLRGGKLGDLTKLHRKPFGERRLKLQKRLVDRFLVISNEIDRELQKEGIPAGQRFFLPNGVDTERFSPIPSGERSRFRRVLGLPDVPLAIYVGRLTSEKRVEHLLEIWPSVRERHPQAALLILGSGDQEPHLKQKAGLGVHFLGQVEDVAPYLQAADLFLLPSETEGLSNALLEGMSSGLAVIATSVGGSPDLIAHGQNGWLVPPNDTSALRDATLSLLDRPDLRAELGQAARAKVIAEYALPAMAERLYDLYIRLVNLDLT